LQASEPFRVRQLAIYLGPAHSEFKTLMNSTERIRGVLLASLVISTVCAGSIVLASSASAASSPEPVDVIDVADKRPGEITTLTASFETVDGDDGSTFQVSFGDGVSEKTFTNGFGSVVYEDVTFEIYTDGDPAGEPERTASISGVTVPDSRTLQVDLDDSVDFNDGDVVQIVVENFQNPGKRDDYDASVIPTDGQLFSTEYLSRADRLNIVEMGGPDTADTEESVPDAVIGIEVRSDSDVPGGEVSGRPTTSEDLLTPSPP
jgi:hypothetical protein